MTRKDFELIAEAIRSYRWPNSDERLEFARHMARELQSTNPRFDFDRFVFAAAAYVTPKEYKAA